MHQKAVRGKGPATIWAGYELELDSAPLGWTVQLEGAEAFTVVPGRTRWGAGHFLFSTFPGIWADV